MLCFTAKILCPTPKYQLPVFSFHWENNWFCIARECFRIMICCALKNNLILSPICKRITSCVFGTFKQYVSASQVICPSVSFSFVILHRLHMKYVARLLHLHWGPLSHSILLVFFFDRMNGGIKPEKVLQLFGFSLQGESESFARVWARRAATKSFSGKGWLHLRSVVIKNESGSLFVAPKDDQVVLWLRSENWLI